MKSILFKLNLKGNGIVNFDDSSQSKLYPYGHPLFHKHNNANYSKKVFTRKEDGTLDDYKIAISSACIKKAIFSNDMPGQNTNFTLNKELVYSQIGTPYYLLSGYVITARSVQMNKKSPIMLTSAIQTCNAKSYLEQCTRSGWKDNTNSGTSDTTLFTVETVGDISYESKGIINLNELQFVSADDYYDRLAIEPDLFETVEKYLKANIPSFNSKLAYYKMNDKANSFPELGFKFSNEDIDFLVKYYLERLLKTNITRNSTFANVESLDIKFVDDCLVDTFDSEEGWISIKSVSDVQALDIKADDYYVETISEISDEIKENMVQTSNRKLKAKKDKEDKAAKAKKKAEKKVAEKVEKESK